MKDADVLRQYVTRLGDNALILGQRMAERVAAEPELEEELANANFALDYIGQARHFYTYAGELEGRGRGEDDFAFLRDEREFRNFLLLEQPNGDFAESICRQFLYETWYVDVLGALAGCRDERVAAIAVRAGKEIRYHLRHARQWLLRLGDGTAESHARCQAALDGLWPWVGELFTPDAIDTEFRDRFDGPDLDGVETRWRAAVTTAFDEATLSIPESPFFAARGRDGIHSEHLGYLVAEMQSLQRSHPGLTW